MLPSDVSIKFVIIIIIIIIIIPHSLLHSILAGSQKSMDLTARPLFIHCSAINVLAIGHVLIITAFCYRVYKAGQRLNCFKLSCNLLVLSQY